MTKRACLLVTLLLLCGACTSTWVPPGSEESTVVGAFLGADHRIMADIMKYGFPDTASIRYREGYVLSYDARRRIPNWVAERLNAQRLERTIERGGARFKIDESIQERFRSRSSDFEGSGYVRGRLASASNHLNDRKAYEQTYLLSNVAPQLGDEFRQTFWVRFEKQVRAWARESENLYVFTGVLFVPRTEEDGKFVKFRVIGENQVAVPTHFYKVMLREKGRSISMQAFIVPHAAISANADLKQFLFSVDEVERLAGLDFFQKLGDKTEARLEAEKPVEIWGGTVVGEDEADLEEEDAKMDEKMDETNDEKMDEKKGDG